MGDFSGKVAVVTGAGRGIGFAICEGLVGAGCVVGLNDMDGGLAEEAAARLNELAGEERVFGLGGDVADVVGVREMMGAFAERHGRLDVVVANAGITNFGGFLDYTAEAFDRVMGVNLRGSYFTAQAAAREMIRLGMESGRILLMSSVTGRQAYPNLSAYGVTKAGLVHMAKVLAVELGGYGITVNGVCPGATVTERTLADDPQYEVNWAAVAPNGRGGYAADIAQTALFLASEGARHISGQTIVVDGGWTVTSEIPAETPELPEESSKLR